MCWWRVEVSWKCSAAKSAGVIAEYECCIFRCQEVTTWQSQLTWSRKFSLARKPSKWPLAVLWWFCVNDCDMWVELWANYGRAGRQNRTQVWGQLLLFDTRSTFKVLISFMAAFSLLIFLTNMIMLRKKWVFHLLDQLMFWFKSFKCK